MDQVLTGLKAAAEISRLRLLHVLSQGELNVSELTHIMRQSQPRVSRHLKVLSDAGMVERHKEGNWVLFRLTEQGRAGDLARAIVSLLSGSEKILGEDLERYREVRRKSSELASQYFAENAANWQKLRAYHVDEAEVEAQVLALVGNTRFDTVVDLGTGTGRMLEIFAPRARSLIGLDLSREMLAIARASVEKLGLRNAQVRQADMYALPLADAAADLVIIHQVLHFLDEPQRAMAEARRILRPGGQLLVVDFAPHELEELRAQHAHRRLGISQSQMADWIARADLQQADFKSLPPPAKLASRGMTVSLWLLETIPQPATQSSKKRLVA